MYTRRCLVYVVRAPNHALATHAAINPAVHSPTEIPTPALPARRIDRLERRAQKSRIRVIPRFIPTQGTPNFPHALRRPSCLSQRNIALKHLAKKLKPFITRFSDVLNFQSFGLINCDQYYDDYVAKRMPKTVKLALVQLRHNTFHPAYMNVVLNSLSTFKTTFYGNGVPEGATM